MKMSLAKAVALAATLGAAASVQAAISIEPNGQGQVLLYPLYTVENGNDTAISVTNTTGEFKAVKIRFREALNSQDVLDFHVFLSPEDVWNGVVIPTADGAKLFSRDTSCTVPAIPAGGQAFTNLAYTGGAVETATRGADGGPQDLKRTRVGYVEVIELGVLDPAYTLTSPAATAIVAPAQKTLGFAVKHQNGVPGNCGLITQEYLNGAWKDGSGTFSNGFVNVAGLAAPAVLARTTANTGGLNVSGGLGGLYGVGTVTNVFAGQQIGYDATAIEGFIDVTGVNANLHNATGYSFPDLNGNRTPGTSVTTPQAGIGATKDALITNPVTGAVTTETFKSTIDAVSAVLQRTQLNNEFSVEAAVGAGTDWVINFPTKHYYLWDSQISAASGKRTSFAASGLPLAVAGAPAGSVTDTPVNEPATAAGNFAGGAGAAANNVRPFELKSLWKGTAGAAKAEVPVNLSYLNREEGKTLVNPEISFSPRPTIQVTGATLAYEANVLTFNNSNVLVAGDSYARYNFPIESAFKSGWASVKLNTTPAQNIVNNAGGTAVGSAGLPAIGFATIKVSNGDLDGVLSNYNAAWNHKSN